MDNSQISKDRSSMRNQQRTMSLSSTDSTSSDESNKETNVSRRDYFVGSASNPNYFRETPVTFNEAVNGLVPSPPLSHLPEDDGSRSTLHRLHQRFENLRLLSDSSHGILRSDSSVTSEKISGKKLPRESFLALQSLENTELNSATSTAHLELVRATQRLSQLQDLMAAMSANAEVTPQRNASTFQGVRPKQSYLQSANYLDTEASASAMQSLLEKPPSSLPILESNTRIANGPSKVYKNKPQSQSQNYVSLWEESAARKKNLSSLKKLLQNAQKPERNVSSNDQFSRRPRSTDNQLRENFHSNLNGHDGRTSQPDLALFREEEPLLVNGISPQTNSAWETRLNNLEMKVNNLQEFCHSLNSEQKSIVHLLESTLDWIIQSILPGQAETASATQLSQQQLLLAINQCYTMLYHLQKDLAKVQQLLTTQSPRAPPLLNGVVHGVTQDSSHLPTLNNQVAPGTRTNNYWDNFRSYSRQNLLSTSSQKTGDEPSQDSDPAEVPLLSALTLPGLLNEQRSVERATTRRCKRKVNKGQVHMDALHVSPHADNRTLASGFQTSLQVGNLTGAEHREHRDSVNESLYSNPSVRSKIPPKCPLIEHQPRELPEDMKVQAALQDALQRHLPRPGFLLEVLKQLEEFNSEDSRQGALLALQKLRTEVIEEQLPLSEQGAVGGSAADPAEDIECMPTAPGMQKQEPSE